MFKRVIPAAALAVGLMAYAPAWAETTTTTTTTVKTEKTGTPAPETLVTHRSGYIAYDTNKNGTLEPEEYNTYSYDVIDIDGDKFVTSDEWDKYNAIWYKPWNEPAMNETTLKAHEFAQMDINNDGQIDFAEYKADTDVNLFTGWDIDRNGYIDSTEYKTVITKYKTIDTDKYYQW